MSERRRADTLEKAPPALPNFSNFTNLSEIQAPDFLSLTNNVVNTWTQVNSRLFSFAQASLQSNLAAADELRQIQSPKDLVETQLRILRRAYDSYVEEATQIGQIVSQLSSEALQSLNKQA
jgi:hypothetical protein